MAKRIKKAEVKIYGEINSYNSNSAAEIISRIEQARKDASEIDIHMHTIGGEVFEGTLLYNYIKACDIPVNVYIDGVCASMGTVVMLAADKVYMCENSYLMVHAPSGGAWGNAATLEKAAKGLRGMEANFRKIYGEKTGLDEQGIKDLLIGDNWFTAQEAMDAKLIDGIVAPIATDVTLIPAEELKAQTPTALYNHITAKMTGKKVNHKTENKMDKEGLIRKFGLSGVTAQSSDEAVEEAIKAKLDAEKTRADNAEAVNRNAEKKRITDVVAKAVEDKKIKAEERSVYEDIGEKTGIETLMTVLDGKKVTPSLMDVVRGGVNAEANAGRETWSWADWQKNDPRALEAMAESDPEAFTAIYEKAYKR